MADLPPYLRNNKGGEDKPARFRGPPKTPPFWQELHPLDKAALATAPFPFVGDVVGFAADARTFYNEPSGLNASLMMAGLIPGVPAGTVLTVLKGLARKVKRGGELNENDLRVLRRLRASDIELAKRAEGLDHNEMAALLEAGRKAEDDLARKTLKKESDKLGENTTEGLRDPKPQREKTFTERRREQLDREYLEKTTDNIEVGELPDPNDLYASGKISKEERDLLLRENAANSTMEQLQVLEPMLGTEPRIAQGLADTFLNKDFEKLSGIRRRRFLEQVDKILFGDIDRLDELGALTEKQAYTLRQLKSLAAKYSPHGGKRPKALWELKPEKIEQIAKEVRERLDRKGY